MTDVTTLGGEGGEYGLQAGAAEIHLEVNTMDKGEVKILLCGAVNAV